jgi:hypothetical protein
MLFQTPLILWFLLPCYVVFGDNHRNAMLRSANATPTTVTLQLDELTRNLFRQDISSGSASCLYRVH